MRRAATNCFVAAVFGVAACHHAPSFPTSWADVRAAGDVAFIVGETRSSSHGRPVQAARVRLVGATGDTGDSTWTDATGAFVLGPVAPGDRIQVNALLHQAAFQPLVLRAGVVDTVRLRLKYDDRFVIWDCIGPVKPDNTQGFGPEFCRP